MPKGFFTVSLDVADKIAKHCRSINTALPLLAYLVLRKHAKRGKEVTTAGVPAVAKALNITHHKSGLALQELRKITCGPMGQHKVLTTPHEVAKNGEQIPSFYNGFPVKVVSEGEGPTIALPKMLILDRADSGQRLPAITRLAKEIRNQAELIDAVMLFLHLYGQHHYGDCGGVNPQTGLFRSWKNEGECFDGQAKLGFQGYLQYQQTFLSLWLASSGGDQILPRQSFLDCVTEGDCLRFHKALSTLRELNVFYEVAMVFEKDPTAFRWVEPLYTLYTFDAYNRKKAEEEGKARGGLWRETFACFCRFKDLRSDEGSEDIRISAFLTYKLARIPSGVFAYVAPTKEAVVMSVIRLRYPAMTKDFALGIEEEENRNQRWQNFLKEVGRI